MPSNDREEYDRDVATARQSLGEEAFSVAWAEGRVMTMEQAIEYALGNGPQDGERFLGPTRTWV